MDCDVLVQGEIAPLFDELHQRVQVVTRTDDRTPPIMDVVSPLIGDREIFTLFHCFTYWATQATYNEAPEGIYDWLWANFDPNHHQTNTALLLFEPSGIPDIATAHLIAMRERIAPINIHVVNGTDQSVFNLVFYKQFSHIRDKLFSYWEHAGAQTRIVHYTSGYAPWVEKQPGMDAYENPILGRPCHEIYQENLRQFDTTFPRK